MKNIIIVPIILMSALLFGATYVSAEEQSFTTGTERNVKEPVLSPKVKSVKRGVVINCKKSDLNEDGIVNPLDLGLFKQVTISHDLNNDGVIDWDGVNTDQNTDLDVIRTCYLKTTGGLEDCEKADLNKDGIVNPLDLGLFKQATISHDLNNDGIIDWGEALSKKTDLETLKTCFLTKTDSKDDKHYNVPDRIKDKDVEEKQTNIKEKRVELEQRREAKKAELTEKKEEQRKKLLEKRGERVMAYAERMRKRLNAAVDRIEKLGERVASRIEKFEERGVDTSTAKAHLEDSKVKIVEARLGIEEAQNAIEQALETENPKEAFAGVREIVKETIKNIKEAHKSVVEAIKSLKSSLKETRENETTSEDNS